jgi:hypothetical protein
VPPLICPLMIDPEDDTDEGDDGDTEESPQPATITSTDAALTSVETLKNRPVVSRRRMFIN